MTKPDPSARNLATGLLVSLLGSLLMVVGSLAVAPPLVIIGILIVVVGALITILAIYALAQGIDYLVHHADADINA